jgi:hypothetical protein
LAMGFGESGEADRQVCSRTNLPDGAEGRLDAANAPRRRGCNGERAARSNMPVLFASETGAPCQDCPLDKPKASRGFVLQGDILQSAQARLWGAVFWQSAQARLWGAVF